MNRLPVASVMESLYPRSDGTHRTPGLWLPIASKHPAAAATVERDHRTKRMWEVEPLPCPVADCAGLRGRIRPVAGPRRRADFGALGRAPHEPEAASNVARVSA